jgi:FecR protein
MKHTLLVAALSLGLAAAAQAVPTDVTYTEGDATTRYTNGKQEDTSIGDVLNTGDSVKTGDDGQVEMDQKGVTIRVNHGTVFTLMEMEKGGQKAPVLSVALGSIKFRYGKLTGQEPLVRTNAAVLGVRGTEFTVFSGADGSTLIAVDAGQVTVQAEGQSVELASAEGVEVPLGKPPGDKFVVHSDQIDYSKWNNDKLNAMLADPLGAMQSIENAMAVYVKDASDYAALFNDYSEKLKEERNKMVEITKEQGAEEGRKYADENVIPLIQKTFILGINVRFTALAALSLRRFVGGRLYLFMKERNITHPNDSTYKDFIVRYSGFLADFEKSIVPYLVKADI